MRFRRIPENLREQFGLVLLVLIYAAVVGWLASHHELWRDEVRALNIVRASGSLSELFANLRNEGHPALWYLLLYAFSWLTSSNLILPLCSAAAAVAAVTLFVARAPFSALEKTLFVFGYFPIYEYSVASRNYGVGMLLLFCFCSLQRDGLRRPIAIGCVLFLLANTSALGATVTIALLLSLLVERAIAGVRGNRPQVRADPSMDREDPSMDREDAMQKSWRGVATVALLGGVGVALAALQMAPDESTVVTQVGTHGIGHIALSIWRSVRSQGAFAEHLFSYRMHIAAVVVLLPCYAYLIRRPSVLTFLLSTVLGMELVDRLIYPLQHLRHQGFLLLAIFAAIWLARSRPPEILRGAAAFFDRFQSYAWAGRAALVALLVLQVDAGFAIARNELRFARSSGESFARFLEAHAVYRDAIIVSEPDYYAETLPYYIDNRIYVPRERAFSTVVSFTERSARELSLADLTHTASDLARTHGVPVLILWGHPFFEPGEHPYSFGRKMRITREGLRAFEAETAFLQHFGDASGDENYSVYEYRRIAE